MFYEKVRDKLQIQKEKKKINKQDSEADPYKGVGVNELEEVLSKLGIQISRCSFAYVFFAMCSMPQY